MSEVTDNSDETASLPTRLFQISEPELAELESILPELLWFRPDLLTPRFKMKWRRVMEIITNMRWNGGPPLQCFRIPADDE